MGSEEKMPKRFVFILPFFYGFSNIDSVAQLVGRTLAFSWLCPGRGCSSGPGQGEPSLGVACSPVLGSLSSDRKGATVSLSNLYIMVNTA